MRTSQGRCDNTHTHREAAHIPADIPATTLPTDAQIYIYAVYNMYKVFVLVVGFCACL